MTGLYDWNPMPHRVNICCPECRNNAVFEFAEIVKIRQKKDIESFQKHKQLEYIKLQDRCGHYWHGAIYFRGLKAGRASDLSKLPIGYEPDDWSHSTYLFRNHGYDIGTVVCLSCKIFQKHTLSWPEEAFYSINYKGQNLWVFDKETLLELIDYLASDERQIMGRTWSAFIRHIPTIFKRKEARNNVVKSLNKFIEM